ncbi:MAG: glycosyltransferase [Polyangiaceae bacterium]
MNALAFVLIGLCTSWIVLGVVAVLRVTAGTRRARGRPSLPPPNAPGVSVLKPLCGADPGLRDNLETFFTQDYGNYEVIFGVEREDDPAVVVAREVMAKHASVPATLVIHRGSDCVNPKVSNLLGMLPFAKHDLLLISDSNVRAPAGYVGEMVATMVERPDTGLVTSLFAGTGENGLGSALENAQLNGFCAAGAALPTLLGDALVVGKSMMMSRGTFDKLGGFDRVKNVLAEDFVIGKMFQHAKLRVRIAPTVLENVTRGTSVRAFLRRQLRWGMLRARLRPAAQLAEAVTSPLAMLPFAWMLMGPAALTWLLVLWVLRDVGGWIALRGFRRAWVPLALAPLRELSMLVVWLRAPLKRHVLWRGHRVRLSAGTLVYAPVDASAKGA